MFLFLIPFFFLSALAFLFFNFYPSFLIFLIVYLYTLLIIFTTFTQLITSGKESLILSLSDQRPGVSAETQSGSSNNITLKYLSLIL